MNFKKWVKSIQTAGYNGARTVGILENEIDGRSIRGCQILADQVILSQPEGADYAHQIILAPPDASAIYLIL